MEFGRDLLRKFLGNNPQKEFVPVQGRTILLNPLFYEHTIPPELA
jgi:hypothetical protein